MKESNKLISEFLGEKFVHWTHDSGTSWLSVKNPINGRFECFKSYEEIPFYKSWDLLMMVIDKLKDHHNIIMEWNSGNLATTTITSFDDNKISVQIDDDTLLESTYEAITTFLTLNKSE